MLSIPVVQWRWMARLAFAAAIVVISCLAFSSDPPEVTTRVSDKLNHLLAFFVLTFVLDQTAQRLSVLRSLVLPLLAYGVFIETVQGQLGYRELSWLDVVADAAGIFLYAAFRARWQNMLGRIVSLR